MVPSPLCRSSKDEGCCWLALWIIATGTSQSKQQARELGKLDWPSLGRLLRLSPFSPFGIVFPYRRRHCSPSITCLPCADWRSRRIPIAVSSKLTLLSPTSRNAIQAQLRSPVHHRRHRQQPIH